MLGLKADSEIRYNLFLKTVIEAKIIWGLKSNAGWALSKSTEYDDVDVMPFWSHKAYAKAVAKEEWADYIPTEIDLDAFIDQWLKGMHRDKVLVGVNWNQNLLGKEMEAIELADVITSKLK
jgi:Protein of unknown function (DUF2750)